MTRSAGARCWKSATCVRWMKNTEMLTISPITGRIYWADVRPIEGNKKDVVCVGEKRM